MATDPIRDPVERLREWSDTIRHYRWRTVVQGEWVGHEEFLADVLALEAALRALAVPAQAVAPASEVGDEEKAHQIVESFSDMEIHASEHELIEMERIVAQALAAERAAAWERAAQVAETEFTYRYASAGQLIAKRIRALTAKPESPSGSIPAPEHK